MKTPTKDKVIAGFFLIPPIIFYIYFAGLLDFIQDDAYITYRYVQNYLNGHGLVFNIGDRVEGFTNFGWTVLLILVGAFKGDYIAFSKIIGTIFGAGLIVVTYMTAQLIFKPRDKWFALLPPFLLGANMALAYWSQSGLETAAFAFMAALSVYFYIKRTWWLIFSLTLCVWIRPEGALIAFLLLLIEWITERKFPKFSFVSGVAAFILSIPFVLFKYFYYGSIIPNPFYAKTGFSLEQVLAGLDYTLLFLKHYGFWGTGILITTIFWKKLSPPMRAVLLFTVCYIIYIILIGGDVLKVHRFFLPIFGLSAIVLTGGIRVITEKLSTNNRILILFLASIPLIVPTHTLPKQFAYLYRDREAGLVNSMRIHASDIKETDSTNFSVALTTIGAFSYELMGHTIIDMLGLTDSTIARHPQEPIEEFETTWREKNFNAPYVLSREPDYIIFSTGTKPSAPAEQALLLYYQFIESYKAVPWYQVNPAYSTGATLGIAFKKYRNVEGELVAKYPPEYVRYHKEASELYTSGKYIEAIAFADSALAISPRPYYYDLLVMYALSWRELRKRDTAKTILDLALEQDSLVVDAHKLLYLNSVETGDSAGAAFHRDWVKKLVPWYWPRLEFEVQRAIKSPN